MKKPKIIAASEKQQRIDIVNEIIELIAHTGKRFFYNHKTGFISKIIIKNGRLRLVDYYKQDEIYLHQRGGLLGNKFSGGGTMAALVNDFKDFIMTGEYSNHNHGYGGLYCPHWGYSAKDMEAIQLKALELGYLNRNRNHHQSLNP